MKMLSKLFLSGAILASLGACTGNVNIDCLEGACSVDGNIDQTGGTPVTGTGTVTGTVTNTGTVTGTVTGTGGGGTTTTTFEPASGTNYRTFADTNLGNSPISGTAVRSNPNAQILDIATIRGAFQHVEAGIAMNDGSFGIIDVDGPNADGVLVANYANMEILGDPTFRSDSYVVMYDSEYSRSGQSFVSSGVLGVSTHADDMPSENTAQYTGTARGMIITASQGVSINSATSTVDVNFGAGKVNVKLTDLAVTDQSTGAAATAQVDQISMKDMTISSNTYSGGTVEFVKDGAVVDLTGANKTSSSKGGFYGYDTTNGQPAAVGGSTIAKGASGIVTTTYIAD